MNDLTVNNPSMLIGRTPELIAAEINNIKNQTRKMMLYNSIEIGRRLLEAKTLVAHGEWGKWLEESVDYSQRTATNLMRIFEEYGADQLTLLGDNAKSQALANLNYTQAISLLGLPEEEREKFIENNDLDNMSTRELQLAIKERDEALNKMNEFKNIANNKSEEALKLLEEKQKAESDNRLSERVLRETQANVKKLQETLRQEEEKSVMEINRLRRSIEDMKNKFTEAEDTGNSEETEKLTASIEKAESELKEAYEKILDLENQIKDKPIETSVATIEKVPEEVERELEELRKKALMVGAAEKFSIYFEELVKDFQKLLGVLAEISGTDEEAHIKYKNAINTLLGKMGERVV
jgi:DNA repair exonuclease SbcCD ATPase subunit